VEGMELAVLRGAEQTIKKFRPVLYVENDRAEKSAELIQYLQSLGYVLYWHLPPLFHPDNTFQNRTNHFGGIVSINMLGFHESITANLNGFNRVEGPDSDWRKYLVQKNSEK
jgi:Methyltransferase FkbM domain